MRPETPSFTAAGVAVARSLLTRPSTPAGDSAAEARLATRLVDRIPAEDWARREERGDFLDYVAVRTRFFDDAVLDAIADDTGQIVILGAGYDARALRFRSPGVRFFEVDHPATQADKRRLLSEIHAVTDGLTFVAADFTQPGLAAALTDAGFEHEVHSTFLCEGVLRYLPEQWFRELLRIAAELAAPNGVLNASISTKHEQAGAIGRQREHPNEPVLTVPTRDVAMEWVAAAGWAVEHVDDVADTAPNTRRGRLLVRARA
jgi:methyltransferase (TIGR00027 family)